MKQSHQSFNACAYALCVACVYCMCACACAHHPIVHVCICACASACMHACLYLSSLLYSHMFFTACLCTHVSHMWKGQTCWQLINYVPKTTNLLKGSWTKPLHTKVAQQKLQKNTHNTCVHQSSNQSSHHTIELCLTQLISEVTGLVACWTALHHAVFMLAAERQWVNVNDAAGVKTGFNCFGKFHFMIVLLLEELVVGTFSAMRIVILQVLGTHGYLGAWFHAPMCTHSLGAPRWVHIFWDMHFSIKVNLRNWHKASQANISKIW